MNRKSYKRKSTGFKINTFLIFLIISFLFWSLTKLSKNYSDEVTFKINYTNQGSKKLLQNKPLDEINASIETTGFNLLSYKFSPHKLKIDLTDLDAIDDKNYYYLPNKHLPELKSQLEPETHINKIVQDTIFFVFGQNSSKKVPVKLNANVQLKLGYDYTQDVKIVPDSIIISGSEAQLDSIINIETTYIEFNEVSTNIIENISLDIEKYENLSFSNSDIKLEIKVDKFTEGSLKIPLKVINVPAKFNITTLPNEVTVIYKVGLSNFNKITSDNFEIICDYNETKNNNLSYLVPKISNSSVLVTTTKIVPEKIEFLIVEK